jgi:hypothetical protein
MPGLSDRTLIFLDVDGLLITFRPPLAGRDRASGLAVAGPATVGGNPLLDRLHPDDGRRLLELGCQLVWATTWTAEANEVIAPRIGLPELPFIDWPDSDDEPPPGLHWKTKVLTQWAAGRRFVAASMSRPCRSRTRPSPVQRVRFAPRSFSSREIVRACCRASAARS